MKNLIVLTCILAALPAQAATIASISVENLGTPDFATESGTQLTEFRSGNMATSAVDTFGAMSSFTNQFGWLLAARSGGVGERFGATASVAYEITFTVEDPGNSGYLIAVETLAHGWLTAVWEGPVEGLVGANGTELHTRVSRDSNYAAAPALNSDGGIATASVDSTFTNELVLGGGSALADVQVGTHTFSLRFDGPDSVAGMLAGVAGEAALRYGMTPTLAGFQIAGTPGDDGEEAEALGHFVTVYVISLAPGGSPAPVPEPGTVGMVGVAVVVGLWRVRRRR